MLIFAVWACGCSMRHNYTGNHGTFTLTVIDQNGYLVRNPAIVATLSSDAHRHPVKFTRGVAVIQRLSPSDTLLISTDTRVFALPIANLESALIQLDGGSLTGADTYPPTMLNTGYGMVDRDDYIQPANHLDPGGDPSLMSYPDLASYLEGRVAGVQVVRGRAGGREIQIRGQGSIMMSNAALIVVDGIVYDSFESANSSLNLNDIESIDVLKDGSMWGSRGANGVVVITTKSGRSRR